MNDSEEERKLNVYGCILASLVVENGGELLVKLGKNKGRLMCKLEKKVEDDVYVKLWVDIENNAAPIKGQ